MIAFSCPTCQATLKAPEEKVGAQSKRCQAREFPRGNHAGALSQYAAIPVAAAAVGRWCCRGAGLAATLRRPRLSRRGSASRLPSHC